MRGEALAALVQASDVGDGDAAVGLAGAHRPNDAPLGARRRRRRSSRSWATCALVAAGPGLRGLPGHDDGDAVGLRAEAGAGLRDVVGDEQVDALAGGLLGRPLQRAGLGREAHDERPALAGPSAGRARHGGRLGQDVRRRLQVQVQALRAGQLGRRPRLRGRKSATAAAMTSASQPGSAASTASRMRAAVSASTTSAPSGGGHAGGALDERHAGAALQRRLGDGEAHPPARAVADEAHRVDGLRGAAGADDDVPAGEVGGHGRRAVRGGRAAGSGCRMGRPATTPVDGLDEERQRREAAHADLPGGQRAGGRVDDRVAELAQPRARCPRWPGARTCRRPWPARRRPARAWPGRWR